ncbi:MAG TPA: Hpt domain-containing protein [Terracidiphilus sp.]|nr:Hpt domain-containing protein [Terracidiphilus sp.]
MATDAQAALSAALDRLWTQFLPQMQERVEILETAAQAFAAGPLPIERQQEAQAAAHKLAGVLGTFGLTRGTELARELEIVYSRQIEPGSDLAERLASASAELRTIVATRK